MTRSNDGDTTDDDNAQKWLQSLLSGHYLMGCWNCGSDCRGSHELIPCGCAGEVRKAAPCPARYCGGDCLQEDWDSRHHMICKPLHAAMSGISLEACESEVASSRNTIMPYLLRIQAFLYVIQKDSYDCSADVLRLGPHLQIVKCLSNVVKAIVGTTRSNLVDDQIGILDHVRCLRDKLVLCHVESVVCAVEEEGFEPMQWDTNSRKDALQFTLAIKQFQLPHSVGSHCDIVPECMDITNDIILGQRGRALTKLGSLLKFCEDLKMKGGLWIPTSEDSADKAITALTLGSQLSQIAARLAHALGSSMAQQVLSERRQRTMELSDPLNLSDIFAWQPGVMTAKAANLAMPALQTAESWMRLALFADIQAWTCSPCHESQTSMLSAIAQCGLYAARRALAMFVSSFDVLGFGSLVFGHSMALDLLHQAKCGYDDLKPPLKNAEWIAGTLDGFASVLQQITKVINKRSLGNRWQFLYRGSGSEYQVVYIDDEANPLWRMGQVAVVVLDAKARRLLEYESSQGALFSREGNAMAELRRKSVDVQQLSVFTGHLDDIDADGRAIGRIFQTDSMDVTPSVNVHQTSCESSNMECCLSGLD